MGAWLWSAWLQIWPNLVASVIWATPAFLLHHRQVVKRLNEHHQHLTEMLVSADRT
jgi:hypothetical protein